MKLLRYKTRWLPALINVIGLGIAFKVFLVLLSQVWWDYRYDRFKGSQDVYVLECPSFRDSSLYTKPTLRPIFPFVADCSPDIAQYCDYYPSGRPDDMGYIVFRDRDGLDFKAHGIWYATTETSVLDVFNVQLTEGRREDFAQKGDALISESAAARFFPDRDPVGETFIYAFRNEGRIKGIYKDRKENETLINGILIHEGEDDLALPNSQPHYGYFKLAPGADLAAVREAVGKVQYYNVYKNFRLTRLHDAWFEKDRDDWGYKRGGNALLCLVLLAIAILFLAIAAFNYINFAIASIPLRIRDINTRMVFGASRRELILRQLLQAAILVGVAFFAGILMMKVLSGTEWASFLTGSMEPSKNGAVLWIGGAAAVLIAVISGLVPALYSTSFQPALILKSPFALSEKGGSLRVVTIGLQYVLTFIFILSALMLHRQTSYMVNNNELGFNHEWVLRMESTLYTRVKDVAEALRDIPGVVAVTRGDSPIQEGLSSISEMRRADGQIVHYNLRNVPPEYFDFFGLQVVDGRLPLPGEASVALVNEAFVEALPDYGVGKEMRSITGKKMPIVGILKNFHARSLEYDHTPLVFFAQDDLNFSSFMMRISPGADTEAILAQARKTYHDMKPRIDLEEIETGYLDRDIEQLYKLELRQTRLILASSLLSLLITLIGILDLVWLDSLFMRKEIALRKVNGATVKDILWKMNLRYLIIAAVSFVIATPIAVTICRRWLEHFAFRTNMPAWMFAVAFVAVALITLLTVTLQCLRAANANPVESLKNE